MKVSSTDDLKRIKQEYLEDLSRYRYKVLVCGGTGCVSSGCKEVEEAIVSAVEKFGLQDQVKIIKRGCMGTCAVGPVVFVLPDETYYTELNAEKAEEIVRKHFIGGEPILDYTFYDNIQKKHVLNIKDVAFFREQVRIALRNCGLIDVTNVDAYIAKDGYMAIADALKGSPEAVIEEIKNSGLRGRGGAGFPTGIKWEAAHGQKSKQKYFVCNADEGDPGAFMDRSVFEGDPHSVIEGMMIGGYAVGASQGYVYIRAEYPIALQRLSEAIKQAREYGLLGKNILGSSFDFDIEIRIGAGAFVCGEETALMNSVEGKRGEPRQKPPFPFEAGLYGKPTIINNVETLANVPAIMLNGYEWYRQYGTEKSPGTKVFALSGNVVNTGLVEVPMGIKLGDILYTIGGGIIGGKKFKAIQSGGPSGGCLTTQHLNTSVDYESLAEVGAIMGSGGLIVMDEDTCMVDTARYFMDFIQDESCGKCTPCRVGTKRMLEILNRITKGEGTEQDLSDLEELALTIKDTAMCGLGQTAPNPILSTLRYFHDEYEAHIKEKKCTAGVCADLFLSPCQNACPAGINVPGYMELIRHGQFIDAYNLIRQDNPFPAVCGRVCTHPCEYKCRRGQRDESLNIRDLKRFVADYAMEHEAEFVEDIKYPKNGKKIAIIGAGPSGLTCGYYLVRLGYEVDVYESSNTAGGVLEYGIPEYRLTDEVLQHEISSIVKEGVNIILNTEVGKDVMFDDLKKKYDAIYIATGAQHANDMHIEGEDLKGVYLGLDFLKDVHFGKCKNVGRNVTVIGGGNTAIDAARTALRLGAEKVTILYRRSMEEMPAEEVEVKEALDENIEVIPLADPIRLNGKRGRIVSMEVQRMKSGAFDSSGRRKSVAIEGDTFVLETDMVIPAVSQHADLPFIEADKVEVNEFGTVVTDKYNLLTSIDGVFAGGDFGHGPDSAISAIADGKKAAKSIDIYLGGKGELNLGKPIEIPPALDDEDMAFYSRFPIEILPPDIRKTSFAEVSKGYRKLNAMAEANRCLRCDRR